MVTGDQAKGEAAVRAPAKAKHDRLSELKAFDETKAGVKRLVDAGITEVPLIFHKPRDNNSVSGDNRAELSIPAIDLGGLADDDPARRREIVKEVREASEKWGFFQIVNHGISGGVLDEMIDGIRWFHEQESEAKKAFYSRDHKKSVKYNSNFDLCTVNFANWRDTLSCVVAPNPPSPQDLPSVCREITIEYSKKIMRLGITLLELLSEALGLNRNRLNEMSCAEGLVMLGHYYPACPQPEVTTGVSKQADYDFLVVLLQDNVGGLQVLHDHKWVDVPPQPGALVVNIGDLLQLVSNDNFKSAEHRVLANREKPRVSVACFFSTSFKPSTRLYGPVEELLSKENPPIYRETTVREFVSHMHTPGIQSPLELFRL